MYFNQHGYVPYQGYPYSPQQQEAYDHYNRSYPAYPDMARQQSVRGRATWTEGGQITKCGIPWSNNNYMTVAVGANSPYQCGQILSVRNLSSPDHKEVSVKVVDQVAGYPPNEINLHRKAFEALGSSPEVGIINVEIMPAEEEAPDKWGAYLLKVIQTAFPSYNVSSYNALGKSQVSAAEIQETYDFTLQSYQERITIRGTVIYNANTDRVHSIQLQEI